MVLYSGSPTSTTLTHVEVLSMGTMATFFKPPLNLFLQNDVTMFEMADCQMAIGKWRNQSQFFETFFLCRCRPPSRWTTRPRATAAGTSSLTKRTKLFVSPQMAKVVISRWVSFMTYRSSVIHLLCHISLYDTSLCHTSCVARPCVAYFCVTHI